MKRNNMESKVAISVRNVSKRYVVWDSPSAQLRYHIVTFVLRFLPKSLRNLGKVNNWLQSKRSEFEALKDISFEVRNGESIGIVGLNGSGKSTLLQIIAGTLQPSSGSVEVKGRIAALLELGSGFNPEFTGRENVYLNGAILGVSKREIQERFNDIEDFADIGAYIDQPVKTYSSGMLVRLAFSVQVQLDPDVLIIDEALAVGDTLFQKRCFQHLDKMIKSGVTLLFVSHAEEIVRTLTDRAVLLKRGSLKSIGDSADIVREYQRQIHGEEEAYLRHIRNVGQDKSGLESREVVSRQKKHCKLSYGTKEVEITGVTIGSDDGNSSEMIYPGDKVMISVHCRVNKVMKNLNVGIRVRNREGIKIYSWGTLNQDMDRRTVDPNYSRLWDREFAEGEQFVVSFVGECRLGRNFYEVQVMITEEKTPYYGSQRVLHWMDEAAFFQVGLREREYFFGGVSDMQMKATSKECNYG